MGNTYFRFKQFTIHQERCAMKVCTDACVLGAWFAAKAPVWSNVLDIGSGTGLLMLMLAQQHKACISGIELDPDAFRQLEENVSDSRWRDLLRVYRGDVRSFSFPDKYDFIISNPPFFENDLEAATPSANLARHGKALSLLELLTAIDVNLSPAGSFGVLLPYHRFDWFEQQAQDRLGFHLLEKLLIRQSPRHAFFRGIGWFSRQRGQVVPTFELDIQDNSGSYTAKFIELLNNYYLNL